MPFEALPVLLFFFFSMVLGLSRLVFWASTFIGIGFPSIDRSWKLCVASGCSDLAPRAREEAGYRFHKEHAAPTHMDEIQKD